MRVLRLSNKRWESSPHLSTESSTRNWDRPCNHLRYSANDSNHESQPTNSANPAEQPSHDTPDADKSANRREQSLTRTYSTPCWIPGNDVLGPHHDKQVLVVGDTIVGFTLTLLLRRAGYDPLLIGGSDRQASSQVTYLCPPILEVFDAIGIRPRILDQGSTIDTISVQRAGSQPDNQTILSSEVNPEDAHPVVVRTRTLRHALDKRLLDRRYRGERTVDTVSRRDGGLAIEFEDGIREWFDVIVDAGGGDVSLHPHGQDSRKDESLAQYETLIETDTSTRNQLREIWHRESLIQYAPHPTESGTLLRVTTPRPNLSTVLNDTTCDEIFPGNTTDVANELTDAEPQRVLQANLTDADLTREWWGTNRMSSCGPAAYPIAPATGVGVTLGIEDALAFVSELTRENRPVSDIVDAYASQRVHRLTTIWRTAQAAQSDLAYPTPVPSPSSLATLGAFRTVALAPFLGSTMQSLQRDGFR